MNESLPTLTDAENWAKESAVIARRKLAKFNVAKKAYLKADRIAQNAADVLRRVQYLAKGFCSAYCVDTTGFGDYPCRNKAKQDGLCGTHLRKQRGKKG